MTKSPQQNLPPFYSLPLFYLPITFTSKNRITELITVRFDIQGVPDIANHNWSVNY